MSDNLIVDGDVALVKAPLWDYERDQLPSNIRSLISSDHFAIDEDPNYTPTFPNVDEVILDHYAATDIWKEHNTHPLPMFFYDTAQRLFGRRREEVLATPIHKQYAFNFMINKRRVNRSLLIAFVEHFRLTSYVHSWTWMEPSLDDHGVFEWANPDYANINNLRWALHSAPSHIPLRAVDTGYGLDRQAHCLEESVRINNYQRYVGLRDIFDSTVTSLITEPNGVGKSAIFTEKSVYAVASLTFPIWVGGYGQADAFRALGFDVFDDIVDHSYQYEEDFLDRCYTALERNHRLLHDVAYAKRKWQSSVECLQANREHLLGEGLKSAFEPKFRAISPSARTLLTRYYHAQWASP